MFDDIRKLFIESIILRIDELIEFYKTGQFGNDQLLKHAVDIATSLYHLREHFPAQYAMARNQIEVISNDYGLLGDFVNISKHHKLDRGNPQISTSEQISERLEITEYTDEKGDYYYPQLEVVLELNNGTNRYLIDVILNVYEFWYKKFDEIKIAKFSKPIPAIHRGYKTREESEQKRIDISIIQAEQYKLFFQVYKWDENGNVRRPMDLSGHSVHFQMREIPKTMPITIGIEESGKKIDMDIPLNEEQSKHYMNIKNEEDRYNFLNKIIESSDELKKEIISKVSALVTSKDV